MSDYPHSPELPWGYWMRTAAGRGGDITVIDEQGRHWESLRHAFWGGRLRLSTSHPRIMNQHLELMLAVLASEHRDIVSTEEQDFALFAGDHRFRQFWWYWMDAEGLTEKGDRRDPFDAKVSPEGIAVLRMLAATRPIELNAVPIGSVAIEMLGEPGSPDECDRTKFEAAEASAKLLPLVFVRERAFGRDAISLLHRNIEDVIPVARTIWQVAWPDARLRDRAFLWMADRSDRWTSWGEMVLNYGADAFTQHLLVLLLAGKAEPQQPAPPRRTTPLAIDHDYGKERS